MKKTETEKWKIILQKIEEDIGERKFNLWLKNSKVITLNEDIVEIGLPNLFVQDWINERLREPIERVIHSELKTKPEVKFKVESSLYKKVRKQQLAEEKDLIARAAKISAGKNGAEFNKNFTIENFVVGKCNRVAYLAACGIIDSPEDSEYNPLFIYSSVGLGKTHLLQAIAQGVRKKHKQTKVIYCRCEDFVNQFTYAIRKNKCNSFREKFRNVDLMIIDDVHFLANKRKSQDEFLFTLNSLNIRNKQVVLASDAQPKTIKRVKESLISRFVAGMVAKLSMPDNQTRLKILQAKCYQRNIKVPQNILEFLAKSLQKINIRELEGALTRVVAYSSLCDGKFNVANIHEALQDSPNFKNSSRIISLLDIERTVRVHFDLPENFIYAKTRKEKIVLPRQIGMYLGRELTNNTLQEIGDFFGNKKCSTVTYAIQKIKKKMKKSKKFRNTVDELITQLKGEVESRE